MVRSIGSPKYSTGFAALWATVRKSRFCQRGMPGASVRTMVIRDRKYVAWSTSMSTSSSRSAAASERLRHVWFVLETEPGGDVGDAVVAVAEVVDGQPGGLRDVRDLGEFDRDDDHGVVQDVVVLDVGSQGEWCGVDAGVEEDGGTRHAVDRRLSGVDRPDEVAQRPFFAVRLRVTMSRPRRHVSRTVEMHAATAIGNQPPCTILVRFAAKKDTSTVRKTVAPNTITHTGLCRMNRTTARNRIVLSMNVAVAAMPYAEANAADDPNPTTSATHGHEQGPVDAGDVRIRPASRFDVCLMVRCGRMPKLNGLATDAERAGNYRLRGDHRRRRWPRRPSGCEPTRGKIM